MHLHLASTKFPVPDSTPDGRTPEDEADRKDHGESSLFNYNGASPEERGGTQSATLKPR